MKISGLNELAEVSILSVNGSVVKKIQLSSPELNVSDLSSGVYFLGIKTADGKQEFLKLVKK